MLPELLARFRHGPFMRTVWRFHAWAYRASGGRLGTRAGFRLPVLLLTTTGRKSGEPRSRAICYLEDAGRYAVIASNSGHSADPAWLLNLRANPDATIRIGRRTTRVRAREADGSERDELWAKMTTINPAYETYVERTDRRIPVVIFEPV